MIPLRDDNPTRHPPVLTVTFIAMNLLVFFWQIAGSFNERLFLYAAVPYNITQSGDEVVYSGDEFRVQERRFIRKTPYLLKSEAYPGERVEEQAIPAWLTLFTSMFMHGGWGHLLGNMLFLWIFGNNIEDALGRVRFGIFYIATGLAASAAHVFSEPTSVIPTIGASGAISGILGGYLLLYPKAKILALVPLGVIMTTFHLPSIAFLGIWFFMQISGVLGSGGGVAWYAHIGGFVAGLLLIKLFESGEHRGRSKGGGRRPPPRAPRQYGGRRINDDPWRI